MTIRVAAVQMCSSTRPQDNADEAARLVRDAAGQGARYVQTPEITNLVQRHKADAAPHVVGEADDPTLSALRTVAADCSIHVHIGSLVVADGDRWANRSFLIAPDGTIAARYDKIHMFDVDLPDGDTYRESDTFAPGQAAVVSPLGEAAVGLSICFDVRFPRLYEALAMNGASIIAIPAAFTAVTGAAHWHLLVRTRAVENGCFVVAAAQEGLHEDGRRTYGHSLIVDPWGRVLAEATETPSVILADLDLDQVTTVRGQVPVLTARRPFAEPVANVSGQREVS